MFSLCALTAASLAQDVPADDVARKHEETETQKKLDATRAQIRALAEALKAVEAQRGGAVAELRERETRIAGIVKDVRALDEKLAGQEAALAELNTRRDELERKLSAQRDSLAALLRSAYAIGRHEELKLILQQDETATASRVLAYHRYFQRARIGRIQELIADLADLAKVQQEIETQTAAISATKTQRLAEAQALEGERAERLALVARLDSELKDQGARLAALGKDEKALAELLEKLRDVFADIPKQLDGAEPFADRRGRMTWPLPGKLAVGFGALDDSGRPISGVVVATRSGAEVRAISHGRVAYADWLKGYGLIVILDHGDGYMSLYGYNETLLRDVGDWVDAGDPIATAGASGGRKEPGLYFELRLKGKPLDPKGWLKPGP
ncbi:murein hydrolase activator EnvC family protein [Tahibacter soli]|uniref:Peptidoglycan DD-metalloendopeptidase family protein n=1 Tax=Tahibacter soli TaxID=2983605 RepID=A0A9X4BKA7_9GAMM|nr:peptidoglycan DD-metalloendopeptidase family protein [Tahibacter soli]MDC8014067.1 peptidoglycan DD-metalloendopeptidase family protein [Tahibacter soli]